MTMFDGRNSLTHQVADEVRKHFRVFDTVVRDANEQFLSNTGQVTSLTDTDLNVYQTYDLTLGGPPGDPDVDLLTTAIEATALPAAIEQAATVDGVLALGYEAEYMKPGTTFVVLIELLSSR